MKTLTYFFTLLLISASFLNCSDNTDDYSEPNPVEGLFKIYEFSEEGHTVEIYSEKTGLEVGYNEISIRIFDKANNKYIANAEPTWMPMMHMGSMAHSAPHSLLSNSEIATVYKGFIVFQMAGSEMEYWDLSVSYNFNGQIKNWTKRIAVLAPVDGLKKVQVFTGSDDINYVLAFVNPRAPQVAINDFQAVLYKMEDMMAYSVVENYKITVDPRMPAMGNHSTPNNKDMDYNSTSQLYEGKVSFTMTGYWKINLKLLNDAGEIVKGENVTEHHSESSLYFELEF